MSEHKPMTDPRQTEAKLVEWAKRLKAAPRTSEEMDDLASAVLTLRAERDKYKAATDVLKGALEAITRTEWPNGRLQEWAQEKLRFAANLLGDNHAD